MKSRKILLLCLAVMLVLACNLPAAGAPGASTETVTATLAPVQPVSTETPTATVVAAPAGVNASPTSDSLNCRNGPGTNWPSVGVLNLGQFTQVVGKTPDGTWLYVAHPTSPGNFCWISAAFATVTGDLNSIQIVALPPTPTKAPGSGKPNVTLIEISLKPDEYHVGGCIGPIQPMKISAKIGLDGPATIKWYFKDEQSGKLSTHELEFKKADIQDVSDSFTPPVHDGKFKVSLIIDGYDLKGIKNHDTYEISC
jgi:uncharacterized protein YraI